MKKKIIKSLFLMLFTMTALIFTVVISSAAYLGDVDGSDTVTAGDARMILRHAAKLENISEEYITLADVNGDEKITAADARLALRMAAKLDELVDSCDHDYKLIYELESFCDYEGERKYECTVCGKVYTEKIPTVPHDYTLEFELEPECEMDGTKKYICTVCGDTYIETSPATGHNYSSSVKKAATCEEAGIKEFNCSNCGETYTETIAELGHDYIGATCTSSGTCSRCGKTVSATGHTYASEGVVTKQPTCTTTGIKETECTKCGFVKKDTIGMTSHVEKAPATCTAPSVCKYCGIQMADELGHDYSDSTGKCIRCGYTMASSVSEAYFDCMYLEEIIIDAMEAGMYYLEIGAYSSYYQDCYAPMTAVYRTCYIICKPFPALKTVADYYYKAWKTMENAINNNLDSNGKITMNSSTTNALITAENKSVEYNIEALKAWEKVKF